MGRRGVWECTQTLALGHTEIENDSSLPGYLRTSRLSRGKEEQQIFLRSQMAIQTQYEGWVCGAVMGRSSFNISGIRNEVMVSLSSRAGHWELVFSILRFLSVSSPPSWYSLSQAQGTPFQVCPYSEPLCPILFSTEVMHHRMLGENKSH